MSSHLLFPAQTRPQAPANYAPKRCVSNCLKRANEKQREYQIGSISLCIFLFRIRLGDVVSNTPLFLNGKITQSVGNYQ